MYSVTVIVYKLLVRLGRGFFFVVKLKSCLSPLFQNEYECETFYICEIEFYSHVHFHANQTHFLLDDFASGLVLKQRQNVTATGKCQPVRLFNFSVISQQPQTSSTEGR